MISETDKQLIAELSNLLNQGLSVNAASKVLGYKRNSLYQKLYRLGYRIENRTSLVPIHAEPIPKTAA